MSRPMANFHLPLSTELHELLREEAEESGQPATAIARQILQDGLAQRRKVRLRRQIATWAAAHAGTDLDLP
jgi:plasmid stability protein